MSKNRDKASILDIFKAGTKILNFIEGINISDLKSDEMRLDAILHNIQIIGEATKRLSWEFREENTHIPWEDMAGMRDKIVHEYHNIDLDIVWVVINQEISELLEQISPLLPKKSEVNVPQDKSQ